MEGEDEKQHASKEWQCERTVMHASKDSGMLIHLGGLGATSGVMLQLDHKENVSGEGKGSSETCLFYN